MMRSVVQFVVGVWLIASLGLALGTLMTEVRAGGHPILMAERLPGAALYLASAALAAVCWVRVAGRGKDGSAEASTTNGGAGEVKKR